MHPFSLIDAVRVVFPVHNHLISSAEVDLHCNMHT